MAPMNIVEHLLRADASLPDSIAVVSDDGSITYGELTGRVRAASRELDSLGVGRGDVICVHATNSQASLVWILGGLALGAVVAPVSIRLVRDEITYVHALLGPVVVLSDTPGHWPDGVAPLTAALHDQPGEPPASEAGSARAGWPAAMDAMDPAFVLMTSGTTGRPKGAVLTHGNVVSNMRSKVAATGLQAGDRVLAALPMHHCFALNAIVNPTLEAGATLLLARGFQRETLARALRDEGCTHLMAVPSIFQVLLACGLGSADAPHLTFALSAGAPLDPEVQVAWTKRFGLPLAQAYGMTETSPFATFSTGEPPGSLGHPIDGVEIRVVDADGMVVHDGEVGVIEVRGSNVMKGYWRDDAATNRAIRAGWMHTEDMGRIERDGSLTFMDRSADLMIASGQNVYPAEIERVLMLLDDVLDAAAYGDPHATVGDVVCVDVVLVTSSDLGAEDLRRHCRGLLAAYKVPVVVNLCTSIPRNPTGKIDRVALRARKEGAQHSV